MRSAISVVREHGGTCRTGDLRTAGFGARAVAAAVAAGTIERARIGHFVAPELGSATKRAIRVGGTVTCVSAAREMGFRLLEEPDRLHVDVGPHDSRFRRPGDQTKRLKPTLQASEEHPQVQFHWTGASHVGAVTPPLLDVLAEVLRCRPSIEALCILDSARADMPWHPTPPVLDDEGFGTLLERLSLEHREVALRSTTLSQAVGETVARERFREAGIATRPQVELPGGYRVDLLIGDRVVFECEGYGAHSTPEAFRADRERMAWLRACGYIVLNFSHNQIVDDWPSVLSTVLLAMRRARLSV